MENLTSLIHLFVTVFLSGFATHMVTPALTDVTLMAVCPGKDECSLAIYLTGFQQAIIGVGQVIMMPIVGKLADKYGRRNLLTIPLLLSIIPPAILAYSMKTYFFYTYYVLRILTGLVCEGSVLCLAHAYVADKILEGRTSAFGILSGVSTISFLCGPLATRFLSPASTFQVAAFVSIIAAIYMRLLVKESLHDNGDGLVQPLLKGGSEDEDHPPKTIQVFKNIPSVGEIIRLLKSSTVFLQVSVATFFFYLEDGGKQASIMYFLKAKFHFNKNQFSDLMLIFGFAGVTSQLLFMPFLVPLIREEILLSLGLFMSFTNTFLTSIAWAASVNYFNSGLAVFIGFTTPCLRSIASKQVPASEQGKAQGCLSGITYLANIVSPMIFSPLTALFLSDKAPFNFPGFSILCISFMGMMAFLQSVMIKPVRLTSRVDGVNVLA